MKTTVRAFQYEIELNIDGLDDDFEFCPEKKNIRADFTPQQRICFDVKNEIKNWMLYKDLESGKIKKKINWETYYIEWKVKQPKEKYTSYHGWNVEDYLFWDYSDKLFFNNKKVTKYIRDKMFEADNNLENNYISKEHWLEIYLSSNDYVDDYTRWIQYYHVIWNITVYDEKEFEEYFGIN